MSNEGAATLTDGTSSFMLGPWRVDPLIRLATRDDKRSKFGCKGKAILMMLINAGGDIVARQDFLDAIWPNPRNEENLTRQISDLKRVFCDNQLIETRYGEGYALNIERYPVEPIANDRLVDAGHKTEPEGAVNLQAYLLCLEALRSRKRDGVGSLATAAEAAKLAPRLALAQAVLSIVMVDTYLYDDRCDLTLRDAVEAGCAAAQLAKSNEAFGHSALGYALAAAGRVAQSRCAFETALSRNLQDFDAHYLFARTLFAQGDFGKAAQLAERATWLNGEDYSAPFLAMGAFARLGSQERADAAAKLCLDRAERRLVLGLDEPRAAYVQKVIPYVIHQKVSLPVLIGHKKIVKFVTGPFPQLVDR